MKILITGSSGFFGKIICQSLSQNYIVTLGRHNSDIICDLSLSIPNKLPKFDLVVHAAGKAHLISKSKSDLSQLFEVNVRGTQNLLKGISSVNVPNQFVFISSVAVYGKYIGNNISENEKLNSIDPYGLSKIEAEQIVINWCKKNNVICTILRLPLLVGKNPPGNLGAMINAIKNNYYFNIGQGAAKKSMVLAEDVAKFITDIAPIGGIYNLTDGIHPNFSDLSQAIAKKKIIKFPLSIVKLLGYIGDIIGEKAPINSPKIIKIISDLTFDDSKARSLGWKPRSVLEYINKNDL